MKYAPVSSINSLVADSILSAFRDPDIVNEIRHNLFAEGKPCELFNVRRWIVSEMFGITPKTVVFVEAWAKMLAVRKALYNPSDFGWFGKYAEVRDRLILYKDNGQKKTTWSEFSAHKNGQKDITDKVEKIHIEKKTGVGDWHTSKTASTLEAMRKELERKANDVIRWDYEKTIVKPAGKRTPEKTIQIDIHIEMNWTEFFGMLEGFNGDIQTWFKPVHETEKGYLLQMQEIQTSEKKIRYIMEHNNR